MKIRQSNLFLRLTSLFLCLILLLLMTSCGEVVQSEQAQNLDALVRLLYNAPNKEIEDAIVSLQQETEDYDDNFGFYDQNLASIYSESFAETMEALYGDLISDDYFDSFVMLYGIDFTHVLCTESGGSSKISNLHVTRDGESYCYSANIDCLDYDGHESTILVSGYADYDDDAKITKFIPISDLTDYHGAVGYCKS